MQTRARFADFAVKHLAALREHKNFVGGVHALLDGIGACKRSDIFRAVIVFLQYGGNGFIIPARNAHIAVTLVIL